MQKFTIELQARHRVQHLLLCHNKYILYCRIVHGKHGFIYMDVINKNYKFHKHSRAVVVFTQFMVKVVPAETILVLLKCLPHSKHTTLATSASAEALYGISKGNCHNTDLDSGTSIHTCLIVPVSFITAFFHSKLLGLQVNREKTICHVARCNSNGNLNTFHTHL